MNFHTRRRIIFILKCTRETCNHLYCRYCLHTGRFQTRKATKVLFDICHSREDRSVQLSILLWNFCKYTFIVKSIDFFFYVFVCFKSPLEKWLTSSTLQGKTTRLQKREKQILLESKPTSLQKAVIKQEDEITICSLTSFPQHTKNVSKWCVISTV